MVRTPKTKTHNINVQTNSNPIATDTRFVWLVQYDHSSSKLARCTWQSLTECGCTAYLCGIFNRQSFSDLFLLWMVFEWLYMYVVYLKTIRLMVITHNAGQWNIIGLSEFSTLPILRCDFTSPKNTTRYAMLLNLGSLANWRWENFVLLDWRFGEECDNVIIEYSLFERNM